MNSRTQIIGRLRIGFSRFSTIVLWSATLFLYEITLHPERISPSAMLLTVVGLIGVGAAFVGAPLIWSIRRPGHRLNPYLAAISLSVCTVLFIRVSGRPDSILAAFVVLPFMAFYRNRGALAVATLIIVADIVLSTLDRHNLRRSLGFVSARSEDVLWLLILNLVLYASMSRVSTGLRRGSARQASLEALHEKSVHSIALRDLQLRESEMVRTIIFESAADAVIRFDDELKVIEINSVGERMLQISRAQAEGRYLSEFIYDISAITRMSDERQASRLFAANVHRTDGTQFEAEISTAEVYGLPTRQFAMFVRDLGERERLELRAA